MKQKYSNTRIAGILYILSGMFFLLLTTISEALYPNFSLLTNSISDMAAVGARTFFIEEVALFSFGSFWTIGAYLLYKKTGKRKTMILNMIPGLAFILACLSPENVNLVLHSIGALIGFPISAFVVILSYRIIKTPFKYFSVSLGFISLISIFVMFFGQLIVGPCGTCVDKVPGYVQSLHKLALGLGGWESMIFYPLIIWLIGFGSYLLTINTE